MQLREERLNGYIKMLVSDRFIAVTGIRIFFETGVRQYVKISLLDANKYSLFRILDQMAMKETRGETDAIDKRYRDRILMRLVRYRLIDHHRRSIAERSVWASSEHRNLRHSLIIELLYNQRRGWSTTD